MLKVKSNHNYLDFQVIQNSSFDLLESKLHQLLSTWQSQATHTVHDTSNTAAIIILVLKKTTGIISTHEMALRS